MSNHPLLQLVKIQFVQMLFRSRSKRSMILKTFGIILGYVFASGYFTFLMYGFMAEFSDRFGPREILMLAFTLSLFTSVYYSMGILFGFKDFDFLRSLPITSETIVTSKVLTSILFETIDTFLLFGPILVIFGIAQHMPWTYFVMVILGILCFTWVPLIIGSFFAMVFQGISAGRKYRKLITNTLQVLLVVGIWIIIYMRNGIQSVFETLGKMKIVLDAVLFLPRLFAQGLFGDWLSFILYVVISVLIGFLYIQIFSSKILKLNEKDLSGSVSKRHFKMQRLASSSVFKTIFVRELKNVLGNFSYFFNAIGGFIFMGIVLISGIVQVLKAPDAMESIQWVVQTYGSTIGMIIFMALTAATCMINTVSCSISIEGNRLWIIKSLPISTEMVFFAKVLVNVLFAGPVLLLIGCAVTIFFEIPWYILLIGPLYLMLGIFNNSMFGLLCNLVWPKLSWDREIEAVKQSLSVFVTTIVTMGIAAASIFAIFQAANLDYIPYFFYAYLIVEGLTFGILLVMLKTYGKKRFLNL